MYLGLPFNNQIIEERYDPNSNSPIGDFFGSIGEGLKNAWYNITGQTEKTSAYKALVEREDALIQRQEEREDTAYQRASEDLVKAGLSKYGGISGASSSAGGSTGVSGESKGLVYMNQLIDLASKQAGIEQVRAATEHTKAETEGIRTRNGFLPDLLQVELAEGNARVELTKNQSAQVAENIIASVQGRAIAYAEHIANMQIKQKDLAVMDAQIRNYASEIAKRQAEIYHLSKEDEYLTADLAYKELSTEVMKYNYDYSYEHGLRTTDEPMRPFGLGVNADQISQFFKDGFSFNPALHHSSDPVQSGGYAW